MSLPCLGGLRIYLGSWLRPPGRYLHPFARKRTCSNLLLLASRPRIIGMAVIGEKRSEVRMGPYAP